MHPPKKPFRWKFIEIAQFIAIVALFLFVGPKAGIRAVGVSLLVWAAAYLLTRRIPYGWEGQEPSGHVTGFAAVLISLVMCAAGAAMLVGPDFMLEVLGWK